MDVQDIKLAEIDLFLALLKVKSIREVARQKNFQAGQVSKWIAGLERKVGAPLLNRAATGVTPTARALELLPVFERMSALTETISGEASDDESRMISLASSSFLSTHLVPLVLGALPAYRFRVIDLPPTSLVNAGLRGAFSYCFHSQVLEWPQTWTTKAAVPLRWNLYAREGHPILSSPTLKSILKYPFIIPIYWTSEGTQFGNDQCPVPLAKRIRGHETATAQSAAQIAKVTDQVTFLPEVVGESVGLSRVAAPWKQVETMLFLTVKNSTVKQNDFKRLLEACSGVFQGSSTKPASRSKS